MGSNGREKGADEIFCRACGEPIKKEAEICPHCGVRNLPTSRSKASHDPSQYVNSVSEKWYYGVLLTTVIWIIIIISAMTMPDLFENGFMGFLTIFAWIGLPISIYYDTQYVRANNEKWNPNSAIWIIGSIIWILNIFVGLIYIIRRNESMK